MRISAAILVVTLGLVLAWLSLSAAVPDAPHWRQGDLPTAAVLRAIGHGQPKEEPGTNRGTPGPDSRPIREVVHGAVGRLYRGRCVALETRKPIEGCLVRVGSCTTTTDAHGRFELRVPGGRESDAVTITSAGRVGLSGVAGTQLASHRLHEVALRAAGSVGGLLADERGRPCANRVVSVVSMQRMLRDDGWREQLQRHAHTGTDGRFRFELPVPAGALHVQVPELPVPLDETDHVLRGGEDLFLSLQCQAWDLEEQLSGVVCNDHGQPVAGLLLHAVATAARQAPVVQSTYSDRLGRFSLLRKQGVPEKLWLRTEAADGGFESEVSGPHHWGASELRIELSRARGIWLQVVAAATGNPIENFAVQHVRTDGVRSATAGSISQHGHHPGGNYWLPGVGVGSHQVVVWPTGESWLPNLPQAFTVAADSRGIRVRLAAAIELPVTVVTNSGQVVAGATVQLLRPSEHQVVRDLANLIQHGGSRAQPTVRLAAATTNRQGVATLRWTLGNEPLQVRIEGAGIAPHVESDPHLSRAGVTIRVAATGMLRVQLRGAAGMRIELVREDHAMRLPTSWSAPLQLDEQGALQVHVPVGAWHLHLLAPMPGGAWRTLPKAVARTMIQPGVVATVRQSVAADLTASELYGRAFVDGQPVRQITLVHGVDDGRGGVRAADVATLTANPNGVFRAPELPAGFYAVQLRLSCSKQQVAVTLQDWRELVSGQRMDLGTMTVATAAWDLELRNAAGDPITNGLLVLRGDNGAVLTGRPNARGLVDFVRLPVGSYQLQWRSGASIQELGRATLAGDESEPCQLLVR